MVIAANLGFPRIGPKRELKKAVEGYWKGSVSEDELMRTARAIRRENWELQKKAGIQHIPSNDFAFYDQVLDTICMTGAVPQRYHWDGEQINLTTYFAMARGAQKDGLDVPAMEMTKWFDTNYHYIVPEFEKDQTFRLSSHKAVEEFKEAKEAGFHTRPVLLGPISFLLLGKMKDDHHASPLALLPKLLPVYEAMLKALATAGADWVQIDEPCLVTDLPQAAKEAYQSSYQTLANAAPGLHLMVATYFGELRDNLEIAVALPVAGLHVDLVRGPEQLDAIIAKWPGKKALSLGLVDGRNIWRTNLDAALNVVEKAQTKLGSEWLQVAPSCSLLHSPVDLALEDTLDEELKSWLAFAAQKVREIGLLAKAAREGRSAVESEFDASKTAAKSRASSPRIHNDAVKQRSTAVTPKMLDRKHPFAERIKVQNGALALPLLPTTTIGSFPQTQEVRKARADFKSGAITAAAYDAFLKEETERCIREQEELGIDVLVHGEFERNDMVEYFGEQLEGFTFTRFGWVQSYGSRCVKPPVIFGDVSRPQPMTVEWTSYAQGLTKKPVKGMLTGPVTILQWSFVRDDQPRSETCKQIALAIRDEVSDLEKAGIQVIQIDEPAIREGLPLRKSDWKAYLQWAVDAFRLSSTGVEDATQIHTHMCYSEFNDIIDSIAAMDADVISIETSRSQMELLDAFADFKYPNQIGPGVYDIHSPRVPGEGEMEELLKKAMAVLSPQQLWVNPDCGLKTRGWPEVKAALSEMVAAAEALRGEAAKRRAAS